MMPSLWGGGHVCVSLLSDAWYKRSEEENAGGILNGCVRAGAWVREGWARSHLSLHVCIILRADFCVDICFCVCFLSVWPPFEVNHCVCIQLLFLSAQTSFFSWTSWPLSVCASASLFFFPFSSNFHSLLPSFSNLNSLPPQVLYLFFRNLHSCHSLCFFFFLNLCFLVCFLRPSFISMMLVTTTRPK